MDEFKTQFRDAIKSYFYNCNEFGTKKIVWCLKNGINPNVIRLDDGSRESIMDACIDKQQTTLLHIFFQNGVTFDTANSDGKTPLMQQISTYPYHERTVTDMINFTRHIDNLEKALKYSQKLGYNGIAELITEQIKRMKTT